MMLHSITVWLTVLVTVDRYNAVCRAIEEYGSSAHFRTVRRQVALVVIASIVYNTPRFFEHQVNLGLAPSENQQTGRCYSGGEFEMRWIGV